MTYVTLGARGPVTGIKDVTGLNPGNWTVQFTPAILNVNIPQFEVYKMIVAGGVNTTFTVYLDGKVWDVGIYGTLNSWDPVQPLIVRPGQEIDFAYSDAATDGTPPVITLWLRYDTQFIKGQAIP